MSRVHALNGPVLPVPPLLGPGAAPPPAARTAPALPRPSRLPEPGPSLLAELPAAAPRSSPLPAAAPRPSPLPAIDPYATLVLPDALKPGGPEAATVERPSGAPWPVAATARDGAPPAAPRRPGFDELASPDITMMQLASVPARSNRPGSPRRPTPPAVDTRAYFLLNLCLGLLILGGLALLLGRDGESPPAAEDHVAR